MSTSTRPLEGKVAVITGGARGQGRSHAVTLAKLGANIALCDLCDDVATTGYPGASRADMAETIALIEGEGQKCFASVADVRDLDQMISFVDETVETFGSADIMIANAGIVSQGFIAEVTAEQWNDVIDINLTGVFNAIRAVTPHMVESGWGRIIGISSMIGRTANGGIPAYTASKWGVIGLCKSVALALANTDITVNAIAPGNVATPMIHNDEVYKVMRPDLAHPTMEDVASVFMSGHEQKLPWMEPQEISDVVAFIVSDAGRHFTGTVFDISAGASAKFSA